MQVEAGGARFGQIQPGLEAGYVLRRVAICLLAGPEQVPALRAAILEALAPHRTAEGAYRLENEWHHLVARP